MSPGSVVNTELEECSVTLLFYRGAVIFGYAAAAEPTLQIVLMEKELVRLQTPPVRESLPH